MNLTDTLATLPSVSQLLEQEKTAAIHSIYQLLERHRIRETLKVQISQLDTVESVPILLSNTLSNWR